MFVLLAALGDGNCCRNSKLFVAKHNVARAGLSRLVSKYGEVVVAALDRTGAYPRLRDINGKTYVAADFNTEPATFLGKVEVALG